MKKTRRRQFEPAWERKLGKLLSEKAIKFRGKTADNLKAELNFMPNMSLVIC